MNDAQEDAPMGAMEWAAMLTFYAVLLAMGVGFVTGSLVPLFVAAGLVLAMIAVNAWRGVR